MRKSRFSEAQIVGILKELNAGAKSSDLCGKNGISEATLYAWLDELRVVRPTESAS